MNIWPPEYQVRHSPRAKRAILKISPQKGLEVVLPMRFNLSKVSTLLEDRRPWIEKHLPTAEKSLIEKRELPTHIRLSYCNEDWQIFYMASRSKSQILLRPQNQLTVVGKIDDIALCQLILIDWLKEKSKQILIPQFQKISEQLDLPYNNVMIRGQNTRWGSCSRQGNINLNFKLIFLPPEIVRYIMIHELCHTVHLDHSSRFWQLVAQYDANWQQNNRFSKKMTGYVPLWVEGSGL